MHHSISLQSSDASIALNDVLGRIAFAASNETGSDALKVSAIVSAIAEGNFDATNNPTSLVFSTGKSETANEKMRLTSDGNLGINTSSPLSKLEIEGDGSTTDDGIITVNDPSSGGTTSWIKLYADDGYNDLTWHIAYGDTSMFRDLEFRTSFSAVPEVTIEPSSTLNLGSGGTSTKRFQAYDFYSTTYNTAALPAYTFANDLDTGMWLASANNLCFSTAGTERLRIDSTGNVGLKNITPACRLTIGEDIPGVSNDGISVDMEGVNKPSFTTRRNTGNPVFSILPYTSQVYLSAGAYYNGSSWVHSSNDVHNCIFTLDPGNGVLWYAGNNSSSISNIASAETLWDTLGHWKNLWRTTKTDHNWALGSLSIGADYPVQSSKLHLKQAYNTAGGTTSTFTQYIDIDNTSTQDLTNYSIGINIDARKDVSTGKTDSGYIMAGDFNASVAGTNTGTLEGSYGIRTFAGIRDAGTVNNAYGVYSRVLNLGTGTINNGYGIYIHNVNATNSYGLYQSATDDKNYFAGSVGIGTITPAQVLDVTTTETEGVGFNFQPVSAPAGASDYQSLITENVSDSIIVKHLENTSNGSSTLVLKNLIRYGTDFVSIDGAYTTGLSPIYDPKITVKTDTGNVGIATVSPTEKLHINGGNILSSALAGVGGGIGKEDDGVHILYPGGGTYGGTSSSTVTGYIKIEVPAASSATMMAFDLDIYEYESNVLGRVAKFRIAGYEYSGNTWHRTQVIMDGDGPTDHKYKVSFGRDTNNRKAIYISQYSDGKNGTDQAASSLWRYPKVSISNVFCGHASTPYSEWIDDWDVGIVAASDIESVYASHVVARSLKLYESSYDLASLTINSAFTLPTSDGAVNQVLTTDGSGSVTWQNGGGGGSSNLIRGSFAVTTSTSVFTVSGGYNTGSLDVYQNGVKLFKGSSYDFTETGGGTTFTLANAATSGDLIEYVALNASTSATGNTSLGSISVTSNQTVFNTSDTFTSSNLAVFLNGVKL